MNINELRKTLPDYAKDTRLNLGRIFDEEGAPGLTTDQVAGVALASAYSTANSTLINAVRTEVGPQLSAELDEASKAAATVMAMNNVYYRFVHLASDPEYGRLPANLRMNVIGNPGVPKVDFELMSLAVSALNGCGLCIDSHVAVLIKTGASKEGVQSTIRIAAVLAAAAKALEIEAVTGANAAKVADAA